MKNLFLLTAFAAVSLVAGCAPPANTNVANASNTNANANTASAAAPTVDTLMALDKAAQEAYAKGDSKWFQDNLSSKFVMYDRGQRMSKDDVVKSIGSTKCDMKSMNFTEPAMTKISDDAYVLTYKSTYDGSCTMDGRTEKLPPEARAATLVIREGGKWMGAWHGETPIIDPKNPPAQPPTVEKKETAANTNAANSNSNASNSAPPPAAAPSANTDALVKMHQAGWDAFKNKDAKWFADNMTSNFTFVDPVGVYFTGRDAAIKQWTETMKCEGITNARVSDGVSTTVTPTVEVLTLKGTADGTCDGQKNGALYQTAVYVKEGDAWKLAFMMEAPAA